MSRTYHLIGQPRFINKWIDMQRRNCLQVWSSIKRVSEPKRTSKMHQVIRIFKLSGTSLVSQKALAFNSAHRLQLRILFWNKIQESEFYKFPRGFRCWWFWGQLEKSWWEIMSSVTTNRTVEGKCLGSLFWDLEKWMELILEDEEGEVVGHVQGLRGVVVNGQETKGKSKACLEEFEPASILKWSQPEKRQNVEKIFPRTSLVYKYKNSEPQNGF